MITSTYPGRPELDRLWETDRAAYKSAAKNQVLPNSSVKYRTANKTRYSLRIEPWDTPNKCERISQPHAHSVLLTYSMRVRASYTYAHGGRHEYWKWEAVTYRFFSCEDVNQAIEEWERFDKADLAWLQTSAVL